LSIQDLAVPARSLAQINHPPSTILSCSRSGKQRSKVTVLVALPKIATIGDTFASKKLQLKISANSWLDNNAYPHFEMVAQNRKITKVIQ